MYIWWPSETRHVLIVHTRDMANIDLGWEVDGIMTPQESVSAMIKVIESKGIQHSGTFWTWENKVCDFNDMSERFTDYCSNIPGKACFVVPRTQYPASNFLQEPSPGCRGSRTAEQRNREQKTLEYGCRPQRRCRI